MYHFLIGGVFVSVVVVIGSSIAVPIKIREFAEHILVFLMFGLFVVDRLRCDRF